MFISITTPNNSHAKMNEHTQYNYTCDVTALFCVFIKTSKRKLLSLRVWGDLYRVYFRGRDLLVLNSTRQTLLFLHWVLFYISAVLSYVPRSPKIHSHHELAVSFQLTVSLLWAICDILMSSPCSGNSALTVWVANSRTAHSKLKVGAV